MSKEKIQVLLEKYFEGSSTLEDERQLKTYFSNTDIDPNLEGYRSLFSFLKSEQEMKISDGFRLPVSIKPAPAAKRVPMRYWVAAASASLLLLTWFMNRDTAVESNLVTQQIDWTKYEPKDDEQAVSIALSAFKKTSLAIRKGTQVVTEEVVEIKQLVKGF